MALLTLLSSLFLLLALYCALDPFKRSAISDFPDFKAHKVEMPPLAGLPAERGTENLLQKSEFKFFNQIQGPENMIFDPLGRVPYTCFANGRILFWNGEAWTRFVYMSSNWLMLVDSFMVLQRYWVQYRDKDKASLYEQQEHISTYQQQK